MERSYGFTIIEILVVISIMAILAALAIPSYLDFFEKGRLRGATEAVYEQLQYARAQALKRSVPIIVDFSADGSTTWDLGITDDSECWDDPSACTSSEWGCDATIEDITDEDACVIEYDNDTSVVSGKIGADDKVLMRLVSTDFTNISMTVPSFGSSSGPGTCSTIEVTETCFEPIRGLSRETATHIQLENGDYKLQVRVNEVGGVTICRPKNEKYFVGYNECPD